MGKADFAREYEAKARVPEDWWLIPKGEGYATRFKGTFEEAVVDAASRSAFWKTVYQVHEDHTRMDVAPKDRVGPLWATVSVPKGSPLR